VSENLNALKTLRYEQHRELNYSSEDYHNTSKWMVYYDFEVSDSIVGCAYQIEDSVQKQVFNRTEQFLLNYQKKTMELKVNPDRSSFAGVSALYNSILTIKNVLPVIIADESIEKTRSDTSIDSRDYICVKLEMGKRRIQSLGKGFDAMKTQSNFIYTVIIDKTTYLPMDVVQTNDLDKDFIKTSFRNLQTNVQSPAEPSWFYSTYLNEYKQSSTAPAARLLSKGAASPTWILKILNENEKLSSTNMRGKVVLLDFWIKNCGPCIQSVPHLNKLQAKFNDKHFKVISINTYDAEGEISSFVNRHKIEYSVLVNGKHVAEAFGVSGYPTFFVIDKSGRIVYAQTGYDQNTQLQIEEAIKKAL
jgi:thiol-disulfide isomerase/thioredoxin